MYVCISICLSVFLSVFLSVCLFFFLSVCISICLSVYLSASCHPVYQSVSSVCLPIHAFVRLLLYLSAHPTVRLSVRLSVCPSVLLGCITFDGMASTQLNNKSRMSKSRSICFRMFSRSIFFMNHEKQLFIDKLRCKNCRQQTSNFIQNQWRKL